MGGWAPMICVDYKGLKPTLFVPPDATRVRPLEFHNCPDGKGAELVPLPCIIFHVFSDFFVGGITKEVFIGRITCIRLIIAHREYAAIHVETKPDGRDDRRTDLSINISISA